MLRGKSLRTAVVALACALASAGHAQTVVLQETWEGASGPFPVVINPTSGFVDNGQSFQADNLWTAEPNVTAGIGVGPHLAISIVDAAGDKRLEWNADGADGADNDVAFETGIDSPFALEDVVSVTLEATIEVRDVGTNGGRDSTFYFGADFENYFAVQLVTRNSAGGEVIEVEWAQGGIDIDTTFGDGAVIVGGGTIVPGGVYKLEATFTPGDSFVALSVSLTDTVSSGVILTGTHDILRADAPDYAALLDFFMIEGKRRMYHTWRDIKLSIEPIETPEGEGEGAVDEFSLSAASATSVTRALGEDVTFSVNANNAVGDVDYQWFLGTPNAKAAVALGGEIASSLTLSNVTPGDSGSYFCAATDDNTTVNSPVFTLTVVNSLPAAGLTAVLAAALATALGGMAALRRKK
ncbi:MAG: hypothetical protein RLZZ303_3484 [Candidatus Hydrogenedentota bacterium]